VNRNHSTDPLESWLYGLRVDLGEFNDTQLGMTFKVWNLVCGKLSVSRVRSKLDAHVNKPSIELDLQGLGITCTANYSLPVTSGTFVAEVKPGAKAVVNLVLPTDTKGVPQRVKVMNCNAELAFNFHFGKKIEHRILNLLVATLVGVIQKGVTSTVCAEVTTFARQNLTQAIQTLNRELVPTDAPASTSSTADTRLLSALVNSSAPPGSVDWREVDALRWARWVIDDLIGSKALKRAVDWALNSTGRVVVPGSRKEALVDMAIQSGASRLKISVGLETLTIDGVDGVRSWQPLTALDSSTLEAGVTIGTESRPGISVTPKFWIHLASQGPGHGGEAVDEPEIDEFVEIALGLEKPSFSGRMELFVDQEAFRVQKTMAQWMYGAAGCLQDTLLATPFLQHFNMSLDGLSTPLVATPHTTGVLEGDLASLFNSFVSLFNAMYLRYVPAAIVRYSSSEQLRELANAQIAEIVKPTPEGETKCIKPEEAAMKAREFPEKADFRDLFGGGVHKAMDNLVDGFLAHNATNIKDALKDVPPLRLKLESTELEFQLDEVDVAGMSQVQLLRILQPDSADAEMLLNTVNIACPKEGVAWQPTVSMAATVATSQGKHKDLKIKASLPCGEAEATLRASFNMRKYVQLPLPPSAPCVLAAFSEISLTGGYFSLKGFGQVLVELEGRAPEDPIATVCGTYPRLCDRFADVSNLNADPAFAHLIAQAKASCSESLAGVRELQGGEAAEDADALSSLLELGLWTLIALAIGVLTACISATALASAHVAKRRSDEGRPNSLSAECCADKRFLSRLFMVCTSALLVAAFVLRTVSTYFMAVAWSDIIIETEDFGRVGTVRVMTFVAYKMIEQYFEAGAFVSAILFGLMVGLTAYGIFFLCLALWVTPVLAEKRRKYLAAAQFLSRLPFMDVVTYGHFIPILKSDMKFPLGVSAQLRCYPDMGMYVSVASTLCGIAAVQCIRFGLPAADEVSMQRISIPEIAVLGLPIESCKRRTRRIVKISIPVFFLFLWSCSQYFEVRFTQLTGDLLNPTAFGPLSLVEIMIGEDLVAGLMLAILIFFAPLMQSLAAVFSVMGGLHFGGNRSPAVFLLELGNTFAALDVFFVGFVACLIDLNSIMVWTMNDRFGELCALQEALLGAGCAGTSPSIYVGSTLCLLVAAMSSSWFAFSCAAVDGSRSERALPTSDGNRPQDGTQLAPAGFSGFSRHSPAPMPA